MADFTIIRRSGKAQFYTNEAYFDILKEIYEEYRAGSNWDRPNILLMDGKVVVHDWLIDIAIDYGDRNWMLHDELKRTLAREFTPNWLKEAKE